MLTHQEQLLARDFFAANQDSFRHWTDAEDESTDHFFGVAEAAAVFLALCEALKTVGTGMDDIEKITKHTKRLIRYATDLLAGRKHKPAKADVKLEVDERVLILVFDSYMQSGKGISTARLAGLVGVDGSVVKKALDRFNKAGVLRNAKTGWVVAR